MWQVLILLNSGARDTIIYKLTWQSIVGKNNYNS
jgi:hypothetical protein